MKAGTNTLDPRGNLQALKSNTSADVPEDTVTQCFTPYILQTLAQIVLFHLRGHKNLEIIDLVIHFLFDQIVKRFLSSFCNSCK